MLSLNNISLEVGSKRLISGLTLSVDIGSIVYITGKNGAGKTTLLRAISSIEKISSGNITVFDHDLNDLAMPYCLYIGHETAIDPEMRIRDQIEFWASSYGSISMIQGAIEYWGLHDFLDQAPSTLSKGINKKISLSRLMCCNAEIWLLDEVETNLDKDNLALLHNAIISKASSGGMIIISTHNEAKIDKSNIINLDEYACNLDA